MQHAILVDYHQLFKLCEKIDMPVEVAIEAIMKKGLERGEINEMRLFVPTYLNDPRPWYTINELEKTFGVEISACPTLTESTESGIRMKDAVDAKVLIWVKTHLHKGVVPNLIIFVSGDSDFVIIGKEAQKKGKKIEFWSIDPSSVNVLIKRQEKFGHVTMATSPENPFITTVTKVTTGKPLVEADKKRLDMIMAVAKIQMRPNGPQKNLKRAIEQAAQQIGTIVGLKPQESLQLTETLIAFEAVVAYPVIDYQVHIDASSSLFQLLKMTSNA